MNQSIGTKTIYVLLTVYSDFLSLFFRFFTLGKYTHASIGLDVQSGKFFSFVTKNGFHIERPLHSKRAEKRRKPCALYRLDTTEEAYATVIKQLEEFQVQAEQYRYSFIGLLLCIIKIPHHLKNRYFCSQFVSELLMTSGATSFQKQSCLYLPDDFRGEPGFKLCFQGTLGELAEFI